MAALAAVRPWAERAWAELSAAAGPEEDLPRTLVAAVERVLSAAVADEPFPRSGDDPTAPAREKGFSSAREWDAARPSGGRPRGSGAGGPRGPRSKL
jgi:hypothetical protein